MVYIILTAASAAAYCFVLKAPEDGQGHEDLGTHFRSLADHCRAYVVVDGWEGVPLSSVSFLGNTSDLMDREVMTSFC